MHTTSADYFKEAGMIVSSRAYSRYDKTMAFPANSYESITRRWLHVQLVSHTARQIARGVGLDEDLVEAIALGHDLGHPPYGHEGEAYLNELCMESGCGFFAHNAQSARILTVLEPGLNLSLPVLDGILCHNGEILTRQYVPDSGKTRELFEAELDNCFTAAHFSQVITPMTAEGCVVRASDVIGYIGRDIEDAIAMGLITRGDIPCGTTRVLGDTEASIRNTLIEDAVGESSSAMLAFSGPVFKALKGLLAFNYRAIYAHTTPEQLKRKRRGMFRLLFHSSCAELQREADRDITQWVQARDEGYVRSTSVARMAVDYIASMTDAAFENAVAEADRSN